MATTISIGNNMPTAVVAEMFNAVRGRSALAKLSDRKPMTFSGVTEFTFSMDSECDIIGENDPKENGGATVAPVVIRPYKFEYGTRVSDEFLRCSEEKRMELMRDFAEGAARKFAKGMDIAAFHGLKPRSMAASSVVGTNHFDSKIPSANVITYSAGSEYDNLAAAMAAVGDYDVTGIALDPAFSAALGKPNANGVSDVPEYKLNGNPDTVNGMRSDVNKTVGLHATGADKVYGYVGDFEAFRWGYADEVSMEVIPYGDPDNSGSDLKGHNQVYLRCEAYIGWGILDGNAFAKIEA